ncbi:hypothetical protein [Costertonia aggregata]|uniref:Uncharacterized protein n=1 Tax=Costertonia aggregata TaxID=343403 RepID=A0A7H9APP7_9FLAO|nr:hypothetical protein [Costertonia aggregata]QLG45363.1 hypothetical protein HYG79_08390 [Costertonia aggregata]
MKSGINIKSITSIFLIIVACISCENTPKLYADYVWDPEIEKLKGDNLKAWIEEAPFNGKWDPTKTEDGKAVLTTNEEQLFPFIGNYKKEDGTLNNTEDVYQKTRMFFKDDKRGESFVHVTLLTHDEELFVNESYSEMGNVAFSGVNAINESYRATLKETKATNNGKNVKSGIYWVRTNYITYCMAFCQKKNMVFQVAFPCEEVNKQKAVSKIKEVNRTLQLKLHEWDIVKPEDLEVNPEPKTFWKDPYAHIFSNKRYFLLSDLSVKLANTKFEEIRSKDTDVDYLFAYEGPLGEVKLAFSKKETDFSEQEYPNEMGEKTFTSILEYPHGFESNRKIYINKNEKGNRVYFEGQTYFKDNHILDIRYSYPIGDTEAKAVIENALARLKISSTI